MKKYSYLVNKQFKVNRKKNILTIIGIVTSILLFVCVKYLTNFMQEVNIESAKQSIGNYEVILKDINLNEVEKIRNNVKVDKCGIYKLDKTMDINVGDTNKKLNIYSCDYTIINELFDGNLKIEEGNFPKSSNEIALTFSAKSELNKKIGDIVNVDEKQYHIVGFYKDKEDSVYNALTGISYFDNYNLNEDVNVAITVKNKKRILEDIKEIIKLSNINIEAKENLEKVNYNVRLIYCYGIDIYENIGILQQEKIIEIFIDLTIFILTLLFIYGVIRASLQERIQEISVLRCIGATKNKIRYLLIKECMILSLISLIIGIVLGHILLWIIINIIFQKVIGINTYGVQFKPYYGVILNIIIVTFINIVIAMILPIIRAGKISPVEGSKANNLQAKRLKKSKSKIIRFIFGYKGEIAYKNIVANRKMFYFITTILTIILLIFNCFTGFYLLNLKAYEYNMKKSYDIDSNYSNEFSLDNVNSLETILNRRNNLKKEFEDLKILDEIFTNIIVPATITIEDVARNHQLSSNYQINNTIEDMGEVNKVKFNNAIILIYDKASINKIIPYIDSVTNSNLEYKDFNENGFAVINSGYRNSKPPFIKNKNSQEVKLYLDEEYNVPIEANLLGFIDHDKLISSNRFGYYSNLTIIVSDDFYFANKKVMDDLQSITRNINFSMNLKDDIDSENALSISKELITKNGGTYFETKESLKEDKKTIYASAVLIYITLFFITIIGGLNIINTRYINIILRKKEFGTFLAIGIQKDDLRKIIILEGIVQWFISSSIGTVLSLIILKVINVMFSYSVGEIHVIPFWIMIISILILLVINLLSSFLPYSKLKKLEINELIRNEE
ncbi:FtsX-like permease family protein [Clostridium butyricum]|uniref:FtsX-like permease family protein n=1 Tax=Clostridium butyricum TaxID=1492 RepID=UPI00168B7ED5|nr:ABC transporter permease [Clostridium butyricum]MDB2151601.1 ABC transporter permease [Clostridium butyricum]